MNRPRSLRAVLDELTHELVESIVSAVRAASITTVAHDARARAARAPEPQRGRSGVAAGRSPKLPAKPSKPRRATAASRAPSASRSMPPAPRADRASLAPDPHDVSVTDPERLLAALAVAERQGDPRAATTTTRASNRARAEALLSTPTDERVAEPASRASRGRSQEGAHEAAHARSREGEQDGAPSAEAAPSAPEPIRTPRVLPGDEVLRTASGGVVLRRRRPLARVGSGST